MNIQKWSVILSLILTASTTMAIFMLQGLLPPRLPLFYSLSWGENQLASPPQLLIIPGSILLTALVNLTVSWQLHPAQGFFKQILSATSAVCALALTLSFIKIIFIFL